jgi:NitT/TauT family transport system substrate-binding protein
MKGLHKFVILLTAILAFLLAACTSTTTTQEQTEEPASTSPTEAPAEELDDVSVVLQWVPQAQFAGYFAALDQGFYEDEGLNVTIQPGGPDIVPVQVVSAGEADFGINPFVVTLQSREGGAPVVAIGTMIQRVSQVLVSFAEDGIATVPDIEGKKMGSWLGGNEAEQFALLRKYGLDPTQDVEVIKQGFDMSQLLNGDIDVAQALIYNEYAQLLEIVNPETGELYQPEDFNAISLDEEGIRAIQDTLFTTESWLAEPGNQDIARRFLKATMRGWIYCRDNQPECVQIVLDAGTALGESHQTWQMNEVNNLIWPAPNGIGVPNDDTLIDSAIELALTYDLISEAPSEGAWNLEMAEQAIQELIAEGVDVVGDGFQKADVVLNPGGE